MISQHLVAAFAAGTPRRAAGQRSQGLRAGGGTGGCNEPSGGKHAKYSLLPDGDSPDDSRERRFTVGILAGLESVGAFPEWRDPSGIGKRWATREDLSVPT